MISSANWGEKIHKIWKAHPCEPIIRTRDFHVHRLRRLWSSVLLGAVPAIATHTFFKVFSAIFFIFLNLGPQIDSTKVDQQIHIPCRGKLGISKPQQKKTSKKLCSSEKQRSKMQLGTVETVPLSNQVPGGRFDDGRGANFTLTKHWRSPYAFGCCKYIFWTQGNAYSVCVISVCALAHGFTEILLFLLQISTFSESC